MIPEIERQFSKKIIEQAASAYGVRPEQCMSLGGFESYVYEYTKDDIDFILKITHTLRRNKDYIMGELEWIAYLYSKGVSVSNPVLSQNGQFIETIPTEHGEFLAMSYVKAEGTKVTASNWNEDLFYNWGKTMGLIHHHTKKYAPSSLRFKRQNWRKEEQLYAQKYISYDNDIIEKIEAILEELEALPKTLETYGLVHADFHQKNFFVSNGKLTLFDFDDCSYTYFINDISISMYYAIHYPPHHVEDIPSYIEAMFVGFMKGYLSILDINIEFIDYIDRLIRLRHAMMYVIFHQTHDVMSLNDKEKRLLKQHREEILSEGPFIPVDFKKMVQSIKHPVF